MTAAVAIASPRQRLLALIVIFFRRLPTEEAPEQIVLQTAQILILHRATAKNRNHARRHFLDNGREAVAALPLNRRHVHMALWWWIILRGALGFLGLIRLVLAVVAGLKRDSLQRKGEHSNAAESCGGECSFHYAPQKSPIRSWPRARFARSQSNPMR